MNELLINQSDILHNVEIIKSRFDARIIAVIKCGGYGFGLLYMAELLRGQRFDFFGVTEVDDLEILRQNGFDCEVLILRSTALLEEAERIVACGGTANVGSPADAKALASAAKKLGKTARAHISIDTGMARDGFAADDFAAVAALYKDFPDINFCGIFTHFNSSFTNTEKTRGQLAAFTALVNKLKAQGINVGLVHAANSSAAFNLPQSVMSCARIGSAFIGRLAVKSDLKPVGVIRTRITGIKQVKKGDEIGYLAAHKAKRSMTLAVLPIGTHDGFGVAPAPDINNFGTFLLGLVSGFKKLIRKTPPFTVEINSKTCPTVGHIGSNHAVVDITGLKTEIGDEVFIHMNPMHVAECVKRTVEK